MTSRTADEATPRALLDELLAVAGRDPRAERVAIQGADPVFPLPFRIGSAGAASIAAAGLAAADLWALGNGGEQDVSVDVRAASAAMRSGTYLRIESESDSLEQIAPNVRSDVAGMYPARDGRWIYLHCNFAHHRELLDCSDDREGFAAAVANWDAAELESAVVAEGACAGLVRSSDEWVQGDQANAIAKLPLFEVMKIGESPPEPAGSGARPLSGVRVLDLTRVLAGPICARTLAEHGADVLRIGNSHLPEHGLHTIDTGHGKRSVVLDLETADGTEQLRTLARDADVFSQGYRPGSLESRGFSAQALAEARPGIIYVTLSAFGHAGPWSDRRGFDTLVQSVSGFSDEYADDAADSAPRLLPVSALDYITGYVAAFGVMTALRRRATEGGSYMVRVSLAQTGRWVASLPRVAVDAMRAADDDLGAAEIAALSTTTESVFGRLTYLAPVAQLSRTPARWERPAVPLAHDEPVWLP